MSLTGNVTFPKEFFDHPALNRESWSRRDFATALWVMANDRQRMLRGSQNRPVTLKRGQLGASMPTLAKMARWGIDKIRAVLVEFQEAGLLTFETNHITTIITLHDYQIYNPDTEPITEPITDSTAEPFTEPNQKGEVGSKKVEEGKGEGIPADSEVRKFCEEWPGDPALGIPPIIPEGWWNSWLSFRLIEEKKWPRDWRRVLVLAFRADFINRHPKALASTARGAGSAEFPRSAFRVPHSANGAVARERGELLQALALARHQKNSALVAELEGELELAK